VCALHDGAQRLVEGVAVAPVDVAADHPCLLALGRVVGAVEGEAAQRGERASIRLSHDPSYGV
jgi:hypothetical protein